MQQGRTRGPTAWTITMRTLIPVCAALGAAACSSGAAAEPVGYAISPDHTHVYWEVRCLGTSTSRGRFDAVDAAIVLDRTAHRGEMSVTIATAGVDSGVGPLDGMLRGSAFLASAQYPRAAFVSSDLVFDGDRLLEARGEFTLRGISRPLTLRAKNFACRTAAAPEREVCGGDFEADFRRSDYGITFGLPFVADRVRLAIQVEAVRRIVTPPA
jgi:polyisoprenoid-binding protein YceI